MIQYLTNTIDFDFVRITMLLYPFSRNLPQICPMNRHSFISHLTSEMPMGEAASRDLERRNDNDDSGWFGEILFL
jgi:hypothetical protein